MVELSCCRAVGGVSKVASVSPDLLREQLSQLRSTTLYPRNLCCHAHFTSVVGLLSVEGLLVIGRVVGLVVFLIALVVVFGLVVLVAHHALRVSVICDKIVEII